MIKRWKSLLLWGLLAFFLITILGGQAIWTVLGFGDDLTIDGRANQLAGVAPDGSGQGWTSYGGDPGGNRYSAAGQITPANVSELEIGWQYRSGALDDAGRSAADTAFEATPILVDEKLIFCTQFQDVIALDPGTGEELWWHDANVASDRNPANQYTCRGVSYWRDAQAESDSVCATRIFVGTVDNRLLALDSDTGVRCADFGQSGQVEILPSMEWRWPGEVQITSAPAIIGDIVVTGTAISDNVRT